MNVFMVVLAGVVLANCIGGLVVAALYVREARHKRARAPLATVTELRPRRAATDDVLPIRRRLMVVK